MSPINSSSAHSIGQRSCGKTCPMPSSAAESCYFQVGGALYPFADASGDLHTTTNQPAIIANDIMTGMKDKGERGNRMRRWWMKDRRACVKDKLQEKRR